MMTDNKYDIEIIADGIKSKVYIAGVDMSHCVGGIDYHGAAGGRHEVTLRFVSTTKVRIQGVASVTSFGSVSVEKAFVTIATNGTEKSPVGKIIVEGKP